MFIISILRHKAVFPPVEQQCCLTWKAALCYNLWSLAFLAKQEGGVMKGRPRPGRGSVLSLHRPELVEGSKGWSFLLVPGVKGSYDL